MARELGDRATLAHALNNVGTALAADDADEGIDMLEEAIAIATEDGEHDHAARGLVNLGWGRLLRREYALAFRTIERGPGVRPRQRPAVLRPVPAGHARAGARLDTGDWAGAEEDGRAVMAIDALHATISAHPGMVALGRLLVRRGDEEGEELLEEAWRRARVADEAQRLVPSACALAEAGVAGRRRRGGPPARRGRDGGGGVDVAAHARADGLGGALLGLAGGRRAGGRRGVRGAVPSGDGRGAARRPPPRSRRSARSTRLPRC